MKENWPRLTTRVRLFPSDLDGLEGVGTCRLIKMHIVNLDATMLTENKNYILEVGAPMNLPHWIFTGFQSCSLGTSRRTAEYSE